jgi:putative colanic acid biosynthesis UDP-glucose lipid carrier transferase
MRPFEALSEQAAAEQVTATEHPDRPIPLKQWFLTPRHVIDIVTVLDAVLILLSAWLSKVFYVDILKLQVSIAADYHLVALTTAAICHWSLKRPRSDGLAGLVLPPGRLFMGLVIGFGSFIMLGYGLKISETYSRGWMCIWFAMSFGAIFLKDRLFADTLPRFAALGLASQRIALYGANSISASLKRDLELRNYSANRIEIYDDETSGDSGGKDSQLQEISGDLRSMILGCLNNRFERVVFCLPPERMKELDHLARSVRFLPIQVQVCPEQPELMGHRLSLVKDSDRYFINLYERPHRVWGGLSKRAFDLVVGSLILLLSAPLMAAIAVAIRLDSKGPVLFRQRRHGYNHQTITVLKFRTMTVLEDGDVIRQAVENDNRVTRVGHFLRRSSLDELPQLFNVLSGEMSLVGPRPHALAHNRFYSQLFDDYAIRHKVKPGITGLAQVQGWRGNSEDPALMAARAAADIEYIENWSIWSDVRILLLTPFVMLFQKSAY